MRAIAARYMVAWFSIHLKGLGEDFQPYISGDIAQADEDAGLVTIHLKQEGPAEAPQ